MYMVNLSTLNIFFMTISNRAARLTDVHQFWPKAVEWLQKHQPAGAGVCTRNSMSARCGPVQMTWLRTYHFLASLGLLWIGNDKPQWSRSPSFIENALWAPSCWQRWADAVKGVEHKSRRWKVNLLGTTREKWAARGNLSFHEETQVQERRK